jgi:hypothetical protein
VRLEVFPAWSVSFLCKGEGVFEKKEENFSLVLRRLMPDGWVRGLSGMECVLP